MTRRLWYRLLNLFGFVVADEPTLMEQRKAAWK